jgi:hypothetical protein
MEGHNNMKTLSMYRRKEDGGRKEEGRSAVHIILPPADNH